MPLFKTVGGTLACAYALCMRLMHLHSTYREKGGRHLQPRHHLAHPQGFAIWVVSKPLAVCSVVRCSALIREPDHLFRRPRNTSP